ncbi:MAG: YaaR family protein [Bacillaceae bacterium]|nr:YaaR family protein [Bacillaceae bacterium]
MKISQEIRSQLETIKQQTSSKQTNGQSFHTFVNEAAVKMKEEELNRLINEITRQGEKVARFRSIKDLSRYKRLVKQFVQEAVKYGLETKKSHSWNMNGQNRKLTIVQTVDEKLVELTDAVLDQERKSIDLLSVIGEIKGLLIHLYA